MKKNPIELIHSSIYDKVVKSITLFIMTLSLLITLGMDIIHGVVDFHSNESDYQAQNATVSYISDNLLNNPIKDVFFRDLECDSSEEEQQLFPYADQNITRWYSQLICVTRFVDIRLSTTCSSTEYNCGPYCIGTSEGSQCPISKLTIISNAVIDEDADQNLESNRDLYIQRENSSFGIFKIQVVIRGYPCLNPLLYTTAGLTNNSDYNDPENCDGTNYDTDNSVQIEQTTLKNFASQGLEALGYNGVPSSVIDSAITYLTTRNKIESSIDARCTQVDNQMIYDTENCVSSIEQIGFIYVIIKEIFTGFILIILIIEMIILKCRIVNDIRIVTVILKVFIICQMSFIMIEGGLILYQEQLRKDAQIYFWSISDCYSSEQIIDFFANFPNLFSADVAIYVQLTKISIIIIGICEFILSLMFIVQMFHWCFHEKKKVKKQQYEQHKTTNTQPQNINTQNFNPQYNQQSEIQKSQQYSQHSTPRQHSQTNPYQQPISGYPQNYPPPSGYQPPKLVENFEPPPGPSGYLPPNRAENYEPPAVPPGYQPSKLALNYEPPAALVSQIVLGKKSSKY